MGRKVLHCIRVCLCMSTACSLNVHVLCVCVCFHHTRYTCTLPRSIPLSVTPVHGPPFQHAVSNPKQMISGKYRAKVGGMEGGIRWADKKKGRKKESRALSPWPSIRSLEKKERGRGRKEGLWANSSSPLLQSISGQKKYTITRQEEAKIYGLETSPLTSNHLTPFHSSLLSLYPSSQPPPSSSSPPPKHLQ